MNIWSEYRKRSENMERALELLDGSLRETNVTLPLISRQVFYIRPNTFSHRPLSKFDLLEAWSSELGTRSLELGAERARPRALSVFHTFIVLIANKVLLLRVYSSSM